MAKVEYGASTVVSTGGKTFILNDNTLTISNIVLFVSSSSTEATAGYFDGTITFTGSSAYGDANTSKTLTHYRNISGTKTKVFEAVVTSLGTGLFSFNVTTCTQTTQVKFVAYGS